MRRYWLIAVVAALASCGRLSKQGSLASGGSGGAGGSTGASAGSGGDLPYSCQGDAPPDVPLRLLQSHELANELERFEQPVNSYPQQPNISRLHSTEDSYPVTPAFLDGMAGLASGIALEVSESPDKLSQLTGCQLAKDGEDGCRAKLSGFVLTQLFRGLGDADAPAELEQLFDQGQELGGDFASGVRAVLEVALQSPEFLYHVELGRPAAGRDASWNEPTDLEMASRLSFMLWDRGPDDELLAAGENGELSEPAELEAQARRLLQDERGREPVRRFYRELMGAGGETSLDLTLYPDFTPTIQQLMGRELDAFVDDATFAGTGDYRALFEPVTWLNQPLAEFYGFPSVTGDAFQKVTLDATRYGGLLTQPAWLRSNNSHTNPTVRGVTIARGLLCKEVPDEPPGLPINPPVEPPSGPTTTRQRFEVHAQDPVCVGCHQLMDPLGFALEHFDASGRYRETEEGLPIDASGDAQLDEGEVSFVGAAELARAIAGSREASECFVEEWQRFVYGRSETEANTCSREALVERFHGSGDNVLELLVGLTQTDSFRYRKVQEGQP